MCVLVAVTVYLRPLFGVSLKPQPPPTLALRRIITYCICAVATQKKRKKKTKTKTSPFYALLQSFIYSIEISNTITIAQQHYFTTATNIIARRGH